MIADYERLIESKELLSGNMAFLIHNQTTDSYHSFTVDLDGKRYGQEYDNLEDARENYRRRI